MRWEKGREQTDEDMKHTLLAPSLPSSLQLRAGWGLLADSNPSSISFTLLFFPFFFFLTNCNSFIAHMCSLILCLAHTFAHWGICLLQQVIIITWLGEKRQKKKKMKTNFCILYCLTKIQLPIGSMTVLLNISPEPWGKYIAQLQPKALTMVNNEAIYTTTRGSPAASSARAEHAP